MSKPPPPSAAGPPRPDAIATLLTTDDFLPGAQTLLYSIKENLSSAPEGEYEPELIVLATPSVSQKTRSALHPAFCTRIVDVDPISFPRRAAAAKASGEDGDDKATGGSHVDAWDRHCGLTKLNIFRLEQYGTLLYIDADCLVVRDVRHLLRLGRESADFDKRSGGTSSSSDSLPRSLLGAAPDILPPDKFNAGVLVVRPSRRVFDDILDRAPSLGSYDGGDTGLLNAYFPDWYRTYPPEARLPFGCNAQRFMHRCTYDKRPQYWDEAVGNDLAIVHFSSSSKPWEGVVGSGAADDGDEMGEGSEAEAEAKKAIRAMLDSKDAEALARSGKSGGRQLDEMWRTWHDKSRKYARRFERERKEADEKRRRAEDRARRKRAQAAAASSSGGGGGGGGPPPAQSKKEKVDAQRSVTKRFRELRKEGMSVTEAMAKAREECGFADEDGTKDDPGAKVAAMFGM